MIFVSIVRIQSIGGIIYSNEIFLYEVAGRSAEFAEFRPSEDGPVPYSFDMRPPWA